MKDDKYIPIGVIAQETGLPKALLKRFAADGKIPALKTPKQFMCRLSLVQAALDKIAEQGDNHNDH
jgi:hypothetical protein